MNLIELIQKTVGKSFDSQNRQIVRFDSKYTAAKEFTESFGDDKIKEYSAKLPEAVKKALKKTANNEKKKVTAKLKDKGLEIEMVLSTHNGVELFVPVRYANGTIIEKDLLGHTSSVFYTFDPRASTGKFGDYVSLTGNVGRRSDLKKMLETAPEAMKVASIDLKVHTMSIPLEGGSYEENPEYISVKLTPSALKYQLIPVLKKHRSFFPGYKNEFEILTPVGNIGAWVTSKTPNARGKGNYICTSKRDGAIGKVFEKMNLNPGDELLITEIIPKKKYSVLQR